MCGRTCLTLDPNEIRCACKFKINNNRKNTLKKPEDGCDDGDGGSEKEHSTSQENLQEQSDDFLMTTPEWRPEFNCGRKYTPSFNIAPTDITPVLVSSDHFSDDGYIDKDQQQRRVVVPMMWGMIPFWHRGDYRKHGLTTNNCRLEHLLDSKLYRGPFRRGQRCVVLCEGFYEWQTTKSAKPSERAAHLLYMPQDQEHIKIYDKSTWTEEDNVNLMKMAGLFDVWVDDNGDKMYSYSVITFESSKIMSWMHHRMPAILETEQQVDDWLDFKRVTDKQALATLRPATQLKWHRVTNLVNNSRNKSDQCNKPIELVQSQKPSVTCSMNKTMLSWLNVRKRREEQTEETVSDDGEVDDLATSTTSESEAENPPKRPRYRDFKKAKPS